MGIGLGLPGARIRWSCRCVDGMREAMESDGTQKTTIT